MRLRRGKRRALPDGAPRPGPWIRAVTEHPWRALILVVGAGILYALVHTRIMGEQLSWRVELGEEALREIRSPRDAIYVDSTETERLKAEARRAQQPVYQRDMAGARQRMNDTIEKVIVTTTGARDEETSPSGARSNLRARLKDAGISLSDPTTSTLATTDAANIPIIDDMASTLGEDQITRPIRDARDDQHTLAAAQQAVVDAGALRLEDRELVAAAVEIASAALQPNELYDLAATAERQEEAESLVDDVEGRIRRDDVIIEVRDTVTQRHLDILKAVGMLTYQESDSYVRFLASAGAIVAMLCIVMYYLQRFRRKFAGSARSVGVIVGCLVAAAAVGRLGAHGEAFEATTLAVVASLAIVLTALLDSEVAMVASIFMAFFADMAALDADPRLLVAATSGGIIAAFAAGAGGSRRDMIMRTVVVCSAANCILAGTVSAVFGKLPDLETLWSAAGYSAVGVVAAAGAIYLLERPLKIITELRLLELCNPNEPILKRLAVEAPGTYSSSVSVGNLAEAAADAIGADSLLVRTGSFYHDIGKLKRPYYFIENQQGGANPHDRLTAHLSAKVITSHVRDGLEIAEEVGLPAEVRAFIAEHHGTTLVEYFYERALQDAGEGEEVSKDTFRYEGPKPHTRETALFMIADTLEAASRTLANPEPEAVRTMIHNLIDRKVRASQFDECNLTFADIKIIEETMARVLAAVHHQRIKYPTQLEEDGEGGADDERR